MARSLAFPSCVWQPVVAVAAVVGVALSGCGGAPPAETRPQGGGGPVASCRANSQPARVAVVQDLVAPGAAPVRVAPADIDPLLAPLRCQGGELAMIVIDGRDQPLVRLHVMPSPAKPAQPPSTGNPVRDRPAKDKYAQDLAAWQEQMAVWEEATAGDMAAFKAGLSRMLAQPAQGDPDPWPVLSRVRDFFDEPQDGGAAAAHPVLIFLSERERVVLKCRDIRGDRVIEPGTWFVDPATAIKWLCSPNGEWMNAANLPQGGDPVKAGPTVSPFDARVRIVAVKGARGPGLLDELGPKKFEQAAPALIFAASLLQR